MEYWSQPIKEDYTQPEKGLRRLVHTQWLHDGDRTLSLILVGTESNYDGRIRRDLWFELARFDPNETPLLIGKALTPEDLAQKFKELSPLLPLPTDYIAEWGRTREAIYGGL